MASRTSPDTPSRLTCLHTMQTWSTLGRALLVHLSNLMVLRLTPMQASRMSPDTPIRLTCLRPTPLQQPSQHMIVQSTTILGTQDTTGCLTDMMKIPKSDEHGLLSAASSALKHCRRGPKIQMSCCRQQLGMQTVNADPRASLHGNIPLCLTPQDVKVLPDIQQFVWQNTMESSCCLTTSTMHAGMRWVCALGLPARTPGQRPFGRVF